LRILAGSGAGVVLTAFIGHSIAAALTVTGGLAAGVLGGAVNLIGDADVIATSITFTTLSVVVAIERAGTFTRICIRVAVLPRACTG